MASQPRRSTRYVGVSTQNAGSTWYAHLFIDYRGIYIASFASERDAAVAHDRVALRLLGADAELNFPGEKLTPASVEQMRGWAQQLRKRRARDSSAFMGVSREPNKPGYPWAARVVVRKRKTSLGNWKSEHDAAEAHDRAVLRYFGPVRERLNFPERAAKLEPADAESLRREARRRRKAATSSRYIGVTWNRRRHRWVGQLSVRGRHYSVGYFDTEEEAAWKRDELAIKLLGGRARLNFHPETGDEVDGQELRKLVLWHRRRRPLHPGNARPCEPRLDAGVHTREHQKAAGDPRGNAPGREDRAAHERRR